MRPQPGIDNDNARTGATAEVTEPRVWLAQTGVGVVDGGKRWEETELAVLAEAYRKLPEPDKALLRGLAVIRDAEPSPEHKPKDGVAEAVTHPPMGCLGRAHIHFYDATFNRELVKNKLPENEHMWAGQGHLRVPIHELTHVWRLQHKVDLRAAYTQLRSAGEAVDAVMEEMEQQPDLAPLVPPVKPTALAAIIGGRSAIVEEASKQLRTKLDDSNLDKIHAACNSAYDNYIAQRRLTVSQVDLVDKHNQRMRESIRKGWEELKAAANQESLQRVRDQRTLIRDYRSSWNHFANTAYKYRSVIRHFAEPVLAMCSFVVHARADGFTPFTLQSWDSVEEWFAETYALVALTKAETVPKPIREWLKDGLLTQRQVDSAGALAIGLTVGDMALGRA